jgi:glutamate-1-semialdehyde 2,1-aminomutase
MRRKHHDHVASHSDLTNQLLHIVSSSVFIGCYAVAFWDLTIAMWAGFVALFLRQTGHAVLEPPCHDKELTLLGYTTRNKTMILGVYLLIPIVNLVAGGQPFATMAEQIAVQWFIWTLAVVGGRVAYLVWKHGIRLATVWFVKLITDPLSDLAAYAPRYLARS